MASHPFYSEDLKKNSVNWAEGRMVKRHFAQAWLD
jgi:hypothetical protein